MALGTTIVEFNIAKSTFKEISLNEFSLDTDANTIYWVHCDLNHPADFLSLTHKLNFPEHLIQLCGQTETIPQLIDNGQSLTVRVETLLNNDISSKKDLLFGNLIFFLTTRYCFTASTSSIPALQTFVETYPKSIKYGKTPCFILFLILDETINDFSKLLLDFEVIADQMDLRLRETQKNIYNEVMAVKKQVMKIQHHIASFRDLLMRMSGRKITVVSEPCRLSLENLLNHTQIIFNESEAVREILRNTLDQIDNALMQKMNNSMKVLTAFAALFLPLSLIAGIYGMNFEHMPELHWKFGYAFSLVLMLVIAIILLYIFRKKKWF